MARKSGAQISKSDVGGDRCDERAVWSGHHVVRERLARVPLLHAGMRQVERRGRRDRGALEQGVSIGNGVSTSN